ncbi:MAG: hypothetical protein QGF94_01215 [Candidatus Thalassarchaeaceae archaeon]|jgi:DNA-binding MarR family transcriptional regulator|nr:hypothetical protein [Candidatus Thalassarchaeaceae archaeon]
MKDGMMGTLTVEQRVLLHLWDTPLGDNPWEGRPELTQAGVSDAVSIARKHLPRTLKKLRDKGHIDEETRHVAGAKQRCRVYSLSINGRKAAEDLVKEIHSRTVMFEDESQSVGSLHNHATTILDILRRIDSTGKYRLPIEGDTVLISTTVDGRDLPIDQRLGVYENIVRSAWADGIVTNDEQVMLDDMALYLGLEPDDTEPLEKRVREASERPDSGGASLYKQMLEVAWQDGEVDDNEQAMLDSLAVMLGLESSRGVQLDWVCDRLDDRLKAYCTAMEAAWMDGEVSDDEENMLTALRESLSIIDSEHKTILGVVRAKLN